MRTTTQPPPLKNPSQFGFQQSQLPPQQEPQAETRNKTTSSLNETSSLNKATGLTGLPGLRLHELLTSTQRPVNTTGGTAIPTTSLASANSNKAFTAISPTPSANDNKAFTTTSPAPSATNTTTNPDKTNTTVSDKDTKDNTDNINGKDFKIHGLKHKKRNHGNISTTTTASPTGNTKRKHQIVRGHGNRAGNLGNQFVFILEFVLDGFSVLFTSWYSLYCLRLLLRSNIYFV